MSGAGDASSSMLEPCVITPTFCDGLHTVEVDRHGLARLAFFQEQRDAYDGTLQRVLVERMILPAALLPEVAARLLSAASAPTAGHLPVEQAEHPLN